MRINFINTLEDMEWLLSTHLKETDKIFLMGSATIYGNDDSPEEVWLYYNQNPVDDDSALVFEYNSDLGRLVYTNTR